MEDRLKAALKVRSIAQGSLNQAAREYDIAKSVYRAATEGLERVVAEIAAAA